MDVLLEFAQDVLIDGGVSLIRLDAEDTAELVTAMSQTNLDFDDAHQYVAAAKHNLTMVSFDGDFDRTDRGRLAPAQVPTA